jgi:hypothetical protein
MMTLWVISRSTLFVGGDPREMSAAQVRRRVLSFGFVRWQYES